jgi:hypothetical protein
MNLTYIILAHNEPRHLARLVSSLYADSVRFVIHIDVRVDQSNFTRHFTALDMKNITFIKKRCSSYWGSFAIVQATLNCLKFVYEKLPLTDRIILMSGNDYPIKSNQYIYSYLKANPKAIYLDFSKMPYWKWHDGGTARFPYYEEINEVMKIYAGSQWFSLPNYALKILFDFLKLNPDFIAYYRTVTIPDESFFQTLFLNCDEKIVEDNLVNRNLHLIKWDYPYLHPRDLDAQHFKLIKRTRFLFARKFTTEVPSKILDEIDLRLLAQKKSKNQTNKELSVKNSKQKGAVLFLTNKNDRSTLEAYNTLKREVPDYYEVYLLYHQTRKKISKSIALQDPIIFDDTVLHSIGFKGINDKLVPGSNHFPLFSYYKKNPDCDYYWYIEDDVRFNGKWDIFFDSFEKSGNNADFITCHVRRYKDEPNWHWWETLKHSSGTRLALYSRVRSFNPIFRISNRALAFLSEAYLTGWSGHHEVTMASLLVSGGFSVCDLGDKGEFVLPETAEKHYKSASPDINGDVGTGSMRFRPFIDVKEMTDTLLYHPFKVTTTAKTDWQNKKEKK